MHPIKKVTPHQAVAASPEFVDARTSCDDESHSVAVAIKKALQQGLPLGVLVQLVERGDWQLGSKDI